MGELHNDHDNITFLSNRKKNTMMMTRLASSLGEGEYLSVGAESEEEEDYLIPLQVPFHQTHLETS